MAGLLALGFAAAFTGAAAAVALSGAADSRTDGLLRGLTLAAMGLGVASWLGEGAGLALAGSLMLTADIAWAGLVMRNPDLPADTDPEEAERLLVLRRRRLSAVRPAIGGWASLFFLLAATLG